ncbi:FlgO family outer membrane protein [Candidatus Photodesmus anomalopis]|uniref:Lipoprotein n=1 Tax=Candidatus Photodesmus katoptron Akat1 TaxID=1236703 RepID=S3DLE0_9GAMM|nr:FlgO family outer membrane protein [Candidatus Photodesmus katoptron]EPE37974.1 lipoprotein [Candidatus Photodesmus katoptron Akat1]
MNKWLSLSLVVLLTACTYDPIHDGKQFYLKSLFMFKKKPRHALDFFIQSMTEDLMISNINLSRNKPIAVVSFVDLQDIDTTNWLGNLLAESFIYQFQRRGFNVVDFKTTGSIQVTQQGDFVFSRNWKKLSREQKIQYILTGTMLHQKGGIAINARIVEMNSRIVVATAQGFLPIEAIGRDLDILNSISIENGHLIRLSSNIIEPYTFNLSFRRLF